MSAQVIPLPRNIGRWRYRLILGTLTRYWSAHTRCPQVWRGGCWQDMEMNVSLEHQAPAGLQ